MDMFTDNDLLTIELAYKHNPDVQKLIAEIRELRDCRSDGDVLCSVCQQSCTPYCLDCGG